MTDGCPVRGGDSALQRRWAERKRRERERERERERGGRERRERWNGREERQ